MKAKKLPVGSKPKPTKEEKERLKLKRELAKIEQQLATYQKNRRYLPDAYPEWEHAENVDPSITLGGFTRVRDRQIFDKVGSALLSKTFNKVIDSLSDIFDCDKSQICLFEKHDISQQSSVITFRYTYNPDFNDELKDTGRAKFDSYLKAWDLNFDEKISDMVSESIGDFYRIVIDLNKLIIMQNENEPAMASETVLAFKKIPFHLSVSKTDILSAISEYRATDDVLENRLFINDGRSGFVAFPDQDVIWTQSPFLLLRYPVANGQPRYASFSTLGMAVEGITFGNDGKKTSMAIARFMDSCRVLKMSAFEVISDEIIAEETWHKGQLQGGFNRFAKSINQAKLSIPDLGFAPLCSDYVTLLSQKYGADSERANIVAYVYPRNKNSRYFSDIALYFGYKPSDYPVVFTRSFLDTLDDEQDCDFLSTLAHEMAHWLVFEINPQYPDHGVEWAICQDLLEYVYQEDYSMSEYCRYHLPFGITYMGEGTPTHLLDDKEMIIQNKIEEVVTEVGIEEIEAIRSMRTLSKDDIKRVTQDCLLKLALDLTKESECRSRDLGEIESPELPLAEEVDLCTGEDDKVKETGFEWTEHESGASQEDADQLFLDIATHRTPLNAYAPNLPLPKKEQGDVVQLGLAKLIDDKF